MLFITSDTCINNITKTVSAIQERLQQENIILNRLNLPTVQIEGNIFPSPHKVGFQVNFPKILLPAHKIFTVKHLLEVGAVSSSSLTLKPSYCVAGNSKKVEQVTELFNNNGLKALVRTGQGIWCNRDPYGLWKYLISMSGTTLDNIYNYLITPMQFPQLQPIVDLDSLPVEELEKKARFFVKRTRESLTTEIYCEDKEKQTSKELRWQMPKPIREFALDYLSFKLIPPLDNKLSLSRQFLESLKTVNHPLIFEIISNTKTIYFQISCAPKDEELLLRQLRVFFSKCAVIPTDTMQEKLAVATTNTTLWQVFSACPQNLTGNFKVTNESQLDAYAQLLPVMENKEVICQFIFSPLQPKAIPLINHTAIMSTTLPMFIIKIREPISEATAKQMDNSSPIDRKYIFVNQETNSEGKKIFYGVRFETDPFIEKLSQDIIANLTKKQPCWLFTCRFLAHKPEVLQKIQKTFLPHYENATQVWEITSIKHTLLTYPYVKAWKLLSTDELTGLVHFPGNGVAAASLETDSNTSIEPPESYTQPQEVQITQGIVLGENVFRGTKQLVFLPPEVRTRHCYVLGKTRTGKSTLLFNSMRQDIELGIFGLKSAVCVIDPHGDLVEDVLQYIPKERIADTIYFDASERNYPISLNVMNAKNEEEIGQLADDLLVSFKRISESWGERMENILRHCFHTLLHAGNTTFLDIQNLLQSPPFRSEILSRVKFQPLLDFWKHQFPLLPKDATQPILSRMSKFSLSPILQGILNQKQSRLRFTEIIKNRQILLVNLSQGKIGEENTKLLGSLIVSQLQMAAMRQASLPKDQRIPIRFYIDEFQNFTTSAFEKILSEAGKYNLCMTVAHQYISQLDEKTRNALLGNIGTTIVFQLGQQDAGYLKHELGSFTADDIVNLDSKKHEALCKPATQAKDTFKFTTFGPPPKPQSFASDIMANTRKNYSTRYTEPTASAPGNNPIPIKPVAVTPIPSEPPTPTPTITPTKISIPEENIKVPAVYSTPSSLVPPTPTLVVQHKAPPKLQQESSSPFEKDKEIDVLRLRKQKIALAQPKSFGTVHEKLLYYIKQAEYLSSSQIISLCYGHLKESSRASTASRDLKQLIEAKKLKVENFGKQKIYFSSRSINPTNHNLILRDLFLKILNSNLEIAETNFFFSFKDLEPDLAITLISESGNLVKTLWEYDAGTEGISELKRKVTRYYDYKDDHIVVFIFDTNERLAQVRKSITEQWLTYGVLTEFDGLLDSAFLQGHVLTKLPLFLH